MKYIIFLFVVLQPFLTIAQTKGVEFRPDYYLEKAIQIAQIEDKNIFIDTYTPWCGPCKLMDIQFQDPELGAYFNEHYVNIKINMDSQHGPAIKSQYDVFFLPTLLIIDKYGNIKYASEGAISSDELLAFGKYFQKEMYPPEVSDTEIASETIESKQAEAIEEVKYQEIIRAAIGRGTISKEEKILFTQDDMPDDPDFLYNITYLKLQLQDGTQWAAAKKYLATQDDWSTSKNMRFIYDFVRIPGSDMFNHIIDNRAKYDILFGKNNVDRSIMIMVNMRLYQGFPRPEPEEVFSLFTLLDADIAEVATIKYLLDRYEAEENYEAFVPVAVKYVREFASEDFEMMNKIAMYQESSTTDISLIDLIAMMEKAIEIQGGTYYKLYDTISALYFKKGAKKKALIAIEKALELARASGLDVQDLIDRRQMIKAL